MKELQNIKYWLFDLDNTLYSGATKVFDQVDKKMSEYISTKLNISKAEARKIQKNYFIEYNTTLNGMIKNHKINANEFFLDARHLILQLLAYKCIFHKNNINCLKFKCLQTQKYLKLFRVDYRLNFSLKLLVCLLDISTLVSLGR